MTVPVVRKRAKRPKTRTGCRTCRMRHIKCDEERPVCKRCRISGKECLGYDIVKAEPCNKSHQAVLLPKGCQVVSVNLPTLYSVQRVPSMTTLDISPVESYAFDFFRTQTVGQLPGSAWTLSWERLALQMGHHEPAVTHAAIALGSMHRAITSESNGGPASLDVEQHEFALSQYNIAMGHVRTYIETLDESCSDSDVEVVLLVSLLFFCFEVLHSEDARATMHLRTGLRILYERIRRRNLPGIEAEHESKRVVTMQVRPRDNMDVILQTFVRLDGDFTIVGEDEPYLFPVCHEQVPTRFHTVEEAMVHLDAIAVKTHDFCRDMVLLADKDIISRRADIDLLDDDMRNCLACAASRTMPLASDSPLHTRMQDIKADLTAWTTALASIHMSSQRPPAQLLTQIHFFYIWFVVSTWRDANEMLVDRFAPRFSQILAIAEQYVDMHLSADEPSTTRQAFSLGTDLVPCIAMIAFKSRSTALRRRCVALLRLVNLQGVFDSHFLASFITTIWKLEESRARALLPNKPADEDFEAEEVPQAARFVEIELSPMQFEQDFYKADVGRLVYAVYDGEEGEGVGGGELVAGEAMFDVQRPERRGRGWGHVCVKEEGTTPPMMLLEEGQREVKQEWSVTRETSFSDEMEEGV